MKKIKISISTTRVLAIGFALIILLGSLLLSLPIASKDGDTSYLDALFTATSATCVTGLVVYDTYQNWTLFGQIIILLLIQTGGLGFMTIGVYISVLLKKKIGIKEREGIHESVNTLEIAGVVRLVRFIIRGTFTFELIGAILLSIRFIPTKGIIKGIYYGIFHSVSAFCNAGFDLMGDVKAFSSFAAYENDIIVNLTIMSLIIIGGIGFIVWDDIKRNTYHFRKYMLHTKIVLVATFLLVFGGAFLFLIIENHATLEGLSLQGKILGAMFSSVTARTAGFNTTDIATLTNSGKMLTMFLMFIGGSTGSTAGGVKTTTFVVSLCFAVAMIKRTQGTNLFGRRLEDENLKKANAVILINLSLAFTAAFIILFIQPFNFSDVLFEVFSAIGTVGMSTGITRLLHPISKIIIILLMYCGRLGSLGFALSFAQSKIIAPVQQPVERIIVG